MLWALVIYASTGVFSDTDSVALTTVQNVPTQHECIKAGKVAESMAEMTKKDIRFICIPTSK